jgi:Fe2+ or Zn2+ uptake regulation protein
MTPDATPAAQLRQTLIDILNRQGRPMSTTELRKHANDQSDGPHPVVAEQVYRALQVLHRHGTVARAHMTGRNAHWQLTHAGLARTSTSIGHAAQGQ